MGSIGYGNTRLRAQRARLLDRAAYGTLVTAGTLDRMIGVLGATDYAPDLAATLPRSRGLRRLDAALGRNLVRTLRAMRSYYDSPERDTIELLLERWDLRNLLTVIRGRAGHGASDEILAATVPAGTIAAAQLTELAGRATLRETVDLMVAWGVPSRETSRRVLAAWPAYELSDDPVVLEQALTRAFGEHLDATLGDDTGGLPTVLRSEIDETNLLTAFRVRRARLAGEETETDLAARFAPGGRIRPGLVESLVWTDDPSDVIDLLATAPRLPGWDVALEAHVGDPVRLADALETATTRYAVGLFARGDPLGTDVAVAFTRAKEHELANLRWIGRGLTHGFDPAEIDRGVEVIT